MEQAGTIFIRVGRESAKVHVATGDQPICGAHSGRNRRRILGYETADGPATCKRCLRLLGSTMTVEQAGERSCVCLDADRFRCDGRQDTYDCPTHGVYVVPCEFEPEIVGSPDDGAGGPAADPVEDHCDLQVG